MQTDGSFVSTQYQAAKSRFITCSKIGKKFYSGLQKPLLQAQPKICSSRYIFLSTSGKDSQGYLKLVLDILGIVFFYRVANISSQQNGVPKKLKKRARMLCTSTKVTRKPHIGFSLQEIPRNVKLVVNRKVART